MGANEGALSVLCADVAGGASLAQFLGKPEALYALGRCEKRIRHSLETHGGRIVHQTGSKLMAFFADGGRALQSAIEMQRRVSDLPPPCGVPLAVRIGICTGHQVRESRYFPRDGANPAVSLSGVAQPGHILLSVPKRVVRFPWLQLAAHSVPEVLLNCGSRRLGVLQVAWHQPDPIMLRLALSSMGDGAGRLCLCYAGNEMVLDENQPLTRIGRLPDCELVLRDPRCSREHATIERRLDRFVFVDRSANGSFVTLNDQAEVFVHHRELDLTGSGLLSLGAPSSASGAELVQFQTAGYSR